MGVSIVSFLTLYLNYDYKLNISHISGMTFVQIIVISDNLGKIIQACKYLPDFFHVIDVFHANIFKFLDLSWP